MTKLEIRDLKAQIVSEIKDTFYIHYNVDDEDGSEETIKILSEIIERRLINAIKK